MSVKMRVGGFYRQRGGKIEKIISRDDHCRYPWNGRSGKSYTDEGFEYAPDHHSDNDLIEEVGAPSDASTSDGSTASYYELPEGATELQDLISHRDMNAQLGEIFRACYRYGLASHSDKLRDAKKIKFYIKAEIARLKKLK